MITVYTYAKCSTCRDAVKWLRAHDIAFVEKPIRETPPTVAELRAMLALQGGRLGKLFNSSGQDYRALGMKEKLPAMSEAAALALLGANGNLVKRPFVIGAIERKTGRVEIGLAGFDADAWGKVFLGSP